MVGGWCQLPPSKRTRNGVEMSGYSLGVRIMDHVHERCMCCRREIFNQRHEVEVEKSWRPQSSTRHGRDLVIREPAIFAVRIDYLTSERGRPWVLLLKVFPYIFAYYNGGAVANEDHESCCCLKLATPPTHRTAG